MKINPAKEWEELYNKKAAELKDSKKKQAETLKNLDEAKQELNQVKAQLESQQGQEVIEEEKRRLQQEVKEKTQELQAIAAQLGLTEQATPQQIKENIAHWETNKNTTKSYLTDYVNLLTQTLEDLEDLKEKNHEKVEEYQSRQDTLKAQIEEVNKLLPTSKV